MQERGVGDKYEGGTQNGGRGREMETTGSALSCSARSARVELGRGEDQTEENRSTLAYPRGGRHCNREDIDARGIISEKAA